MIRFLAVVASTAVAFLAVPASAAPPPVFSPVWTDDSVDGSFRVIVASGARNVWALGGDGDVPIAYRKSGATWVRAALPKGLTGVIGAAVALSPDDVWAAGYDPERAKPSYILHWDGHAWKVAHRWAARESKTIVAHGKTVWFFDAATRLALRHDGHGFTKIKVPAPVRAAAHLGGTLWIEAFSFNGGNAVYRFTRGRWKRAALPDSKLGTFSLTDGLTAVGGDLVLYAERFPPGSGTYGVLPTHLVRYHKGRWTREKVAAPANPFGASISDGKGGFWTLGYDTNIVYSLLHHDAKGRWKTVRVLDAGDSDADVDLGGGTVLPKGSRTLLGAGSARLYPTYVPAIYEIPLP
jgi:hypothetical protein